MTIITGFNANTTARNEGVGMFNDKACSRFAFEQGTDGIAYSIPGIGARSEIAAIAPVSPTSELTV